MSMAHLDSYRQEKKETHHRNNCSSIDVDRHIQEC